MLGDMYKNGLQSLMSLCMHFFSDAQTELQHNESVVKFKFVVVQVSVKYSLFFSHIDSIALYIDLSLADILLGASVMAWNLIYILMHITISIIYSVHDIATRNKY